MQEVISRLTVVCTKNRKGLFTLQIEPGLVQSLEKLILPVAVQLLTCA